ncbi:hypothetical protein GALMADRAFT_260256 [Galerina marginata CBS 339.88]|uniref:Uncharacterized protein n=1 Tax=Galerina marginata (strain CBS 339.88) TaxID=685588 RepID=A0A067S648_GALM3|nr:hypothetical protein GALMADRAFT_260256 [Galerina marginata CBS 339.88]
MNALYDTEAAVHAIGVLLHETLEGGNDDGFAHLCDVQPVSYAPCVVQEPKSLRLAEKGSEQEAIFRIRGVMCQSNLPPVTHIRPGIPGHRLRQSVTLTALGSHPVFDKYLSNIQGIADIFRTTFPNEKLALDGHHTYEGHPCIVVFNRYLSFRCDTPTTHQIPFDPEVDPQGLLLKHPHQTMHHTEDNQVLYSRREMKDGQQSLTKISPTSFENGDIVEAHFSFVSFPTRGKDARRISCVMNHLILLNDRIRKESNGVSTSVAMHPVKFRTLKRKQALVNSEDEERDKRMRTM